MKTGSISLVFLLLLLTQSFSQGGNACRIEEQQCQELMTYRAYVPPLVAELNELKMAIASQGPASGRAYDAYLAKFYTQASEYRDIRISMYKWQENTATWIFISVFVLTTFGIGLATYQLISALSLGKGIKDAKLEISSTKLVATTSSVGVIILFLSLAFFVIFAKSIYPIISTDNQGNAAAFSNLN
jgi:hypothetical protein